MKNKRDDKLLSIRLHGKQVGILEQTTVGKMMFTYNADAILPVSFSMPIREEPYGENECQAYFGGLLPESETAKKIIGKRYGISANNTFSLLKAIGYDCAGAISCHEMDEPMQTSSFLLDGRIISDDELYNHIIELPQRPLFLDVDGLRLSLAGVQDKAAVCVIDHQIALAENGCPTTHILKPSVNHFEGIAKNEYFCLKLAKRLHLPVPEVNLRRIKDIEFLLIERYDRKIENEKITRIQQEDFCQALGVLSNKKYQNEGGPGFTECFELLKNTEQPAVDRNFLASALVFNYLMGNMDAHAKNFSLLYHSQSNFRLAPFYDMLCTRVYPGLSKKMAMKIGSEYDADRVYDRHWQQLCELVGYRYIAMIKLIDMQANSLMNAALAERESFMTKFGVSPLIDKIIHVMEKNIEKTVRYFS